MRVVVICLLVLGACSRSETAETQPTKTEVEPTTEAAAPDTAKSDEADLDETASILEAPPSLALLDAGKPPREELRHEWREGSKHRLSVRSVWTVDAIVFPIQAHMVMPDLDYELEALVKTVAEDGTAQFELRVANVTVKPSKEVEPQTLEHIEKAAGSMTGAKGRFSIDPRGLVRALEILDIPPTASMRFYEMIDQIDQALRLASLPLPGEPVGRGARWTATQVIEYRGARIQQRSTYELLRIKGGRLRTRIALELTAPKQRLRPEGRSGALILNEVTCEGDGEGTWQLGGLAPRSASKETKTLLHIVRRTPPKQLVLATTTLTMRVRERR
jgi:hypothetical protein